MNEGLLSYYQSQLDSRDTWKVSGLADFFGVSHQTIRRRIEDGDIPANKRETDSGYVWEIPTRRIKQNLAESDKLQRYLRDQDPSDLPQPPQHSPLNHDGENHTGLVNQLLHRLDQLQEKVENVREENGRLKAENRSLKRRLEEVQSRLKKRPRNGELPCKIHQGREEVLQHVRRWSSILESRIRKKLSTQPTSRD